MNAGRNGRSVNEPVRWKPIASTPLRVMGIALTAVAASMLLSSVIELASTNRDTGMLLVSSVIVGGVGGSLWVGTTVGRTQPRDTFAAVGWTWVVVTVAGAVPYLLCGSFDVPGIDWSGKIVNSVFESASGFSCTGSTALTDFSVPGRGLMMYRQMTQWFGGMGVVVLAVAVLPFLGVGGLDLIAAEAPGPSGDRLTPRISDTAKYLWFTYALLTMLIVVVLAIIPGVPIYDAFALAFTALSTGGFSPSAESIGVFDSWLVEGVLCAAMIIGGANFALHWRTLNREFGLYRRDSEFRAYIAILASCTVVASGLLWLNNGFDFATSVRMASFNVISLGTSSGYGNATTPGSAGDFVTWIPSVQMILLFLMVVGACTGSTSGAVKVTRLQILTKHSVRSVRRTQSPHAVIPIRLGARAVPEGVVARISSFFLVYLLLVIAGVIAITALGSGLLEAVGAVVGSLGGMGPALGEAGPTANFTDAFSEPARLVLALLMVIGRLELFPMLLMFAAPIRAVRDL